MGVTAALMALAMAVAASQAPARAVPAADPWAPKQFLYYRAVAFRGMVAGQMCGAGPVRAQFDWLSRRLEKARKKLSKQSRSTKFDRKTDTVARAPQCSDAEAGFMLRGFENAVSEVEAAGK